MSRTFKRTKGKSEGMEITVNDFDGLDAFAKEKGWEEVKDEPKPKRKPGPKPKAGKEADITE